MSQMSHSALNDKSSCYMFKRWLLYLKNISVSAFRIEDSSKGQLWCHQVYWRASLAGGGARNFCASVKWRWLCMFPPESRLILTTNEGLREVLVQLRIYSVTFVSYRFICSWHVIKCCVKTIPETGSCLLLRGCSLLTDEVEDDCCDLWISA